MLPHVNQPLQRLDMIQDCKQSLLFVNCRSAVAAALLVCSSSKRGIAVKPNTWIFTASTSFSLAVRGRRGGVTLSERGLLWTPLHLQEKVL